MLSRPRILVVEDDAPLAHLYCTALTMNGFAAMRAGDGLTALRVAEEYRPDAVLLDLMIPQIDGWTVLKEFQARAATRTIPVVVVTASNVDTGLEHARAVIRKPVDPDEVVKVISSQIPRRSSPSPLG